MKRLVKATIHSLQGLRYTVAHERAVRQEVIILVVAVPLAFFVAAGPAWYLALIGVLLILLAVELLNTSIEKLSDHVTPEHHVENRHYQGCLFCRRVLHTLACWARVACGDGCAPWISLDIRQDYNEHGGKAVVLNLMGTLPIG